VRLTVPLCWTVAPLKLSVPALRWSLTPQASLRGLAMLRQMLAEGSKAEARQYPQGSPGSAAVKATASLWAEAVPCWRVHPAPLAAVVQHLSAVG